MGSIRGGASFDVECVVQPVTGRPVKVVAQAALPASFPHAAFNGRIDLQFAGSRDALDEAVRDADVLYTVTVPSIVPAETPDLQWIEMESAGVEWLRDLPVWKSDVIITSSKGIHTVPMAEHLFAMLLALVRSLPAVIRAQERHEWIQNTDFPMHELRGRTMGIIGWGKIGDGVAHLAEAFGMRVIGTRRSVREPSEVGATATAYSNPPFLEPVANAPNVVYPESDLHVVLAESDAIVLILPLTAQTEGLLGDAEFAAIKEGALLLNMGRGAVVQEDALVRALQSGRLGGAGLDVFAQEPLPASSPLWAMPNVIVSPHLGGRGERTSDRAAHLFAVNLRRYLEGQPLINVVNREQEY